MKNSDTTTVNFHKEYEALMREWQALVDTYRARKGSDVKTPEERYKDALRQRTEPLTGVTGLDEREARDLILKQMGPKMESLVRSVLINPEVGPPAFTLEDARNKYVKDTGIATNIKNMQRLDRAFERLAQAGLNAKELALVDLRKAHGQAWLDALKAYSNENTGKPYAVDTFQRA